MRDCSEPFIELLPSGMLAMHPISFKLMPRYFVILSHDPGEVKIGDGVPG